METDNFDKDLAVLCLKKIAKLWENENGLSRIISPLYLEVTGFLISRDFPISV